MRTSTKKTTMTLNTETLNSEQLRLIRQIHYLSIEVLKTSCEIEFFEKSSLLMKMMANIVTKSNFGQVALGFEDIPYAKQALEYSIENLEASMESENLTDYDH